ncbi:uncharacterized protein LOC112185400 isoform X2 [Rosa chinensis]|uniref:uncharacterized protein LOC112185400 isoform X2 n=1 Tax=Rosa chinensis TaxID=74649 RepID=UPI000D0874CD|nr:uncharacterized protein LOC112185400 isoform X2 [Rosa chinensis]
MDSAQENEMVAKRKRPSGPVNDPVGDHVEGVGLDAIEKAVNLYISESKGVASAKMEASRNPGGLLHCLARVTEVPDYARMSEEWLAETKRRDLCMMKAKRSAREKEAERLAREKKAFCLLDGFAVLFGW